MAVEPVSMSRMRNLWLRMAEIYGHRWTSAYGEDAEQGAGATWAKGLSGLTGHDFSIGLGQALLSTDPWPPTLPQFRAMCLAIPSIAAVTLAINSKTLTTPFTRLVWQHLDVYRLRMSDANKAYRVIRDAYELAREHVMQGGSLPPEPAAAIAADPVESKPADPVEAAKVIAQIHEVLRDEPAADPSIPGYA